ncbi:hypothetical protein JDS99_26390 [Bacillus cereus group sp. N6]|uniref:hypothetical protein n=1 Tax=Bacillus cereus group sp. N6 TaxID=2794583 RepID=UPI0018F2AE02|nr:hypothetical protein [Bacillus cereus group sp. N6]MBJ8113110.1 hypothetical protein [Bacillus cereus group sp. N6]
MKKKLPTKEPDYIVNAMEREYIFTINVFLSKMVAKISVIRLQLLNIKQPKSISHNNEKNLHTGSF